MRMLMLGATIAALPFFVVAAHEELAGTYKLTSGTRTILDTAEVLGTWGKNPNGYIIYGKDGRRPAAGGSAPLDDGVRENVQIR
jgi:Lipocalin-like domain